MQIYAHHSYNHCCFVVVLIVVASLVVLCLLGDSCMLQSFELSISFSVKET